MSDEAYIERLEKENQELNTQRVEILIELGYFRTNFIVKELQTIHATLDILRKELVKVDQKNEYTEYIATMGVVNKKIEAVNKIMIQNAQNFNRNTIKEGKESNGWRIIH